MDRNKIKELIELVENSAIAELEVHFFFGKKVVIRKHPTGITAIQPQGMIIPANMQTPMQIPTQMPLQQSPMQAPAEKASEDKLIKITAPMVGTFYRKPSPDSKPYIEAGDHITPGQVVCLIEAMKLFNEVKSEVSGRIVKVLAEDASAVEFGQVLFHIEPA